MDPTWPICKFDVRGSCKDPRCGMQHLRDGVLTADGAARQLASRLHVFGMAEAGAGAATALNAGALAKSVRSMRSSGLYIVDAALRSTQHRNSVTTAGVLQPGVAAGDDTADATVAGSGKEHANAHAHAVAVAVAATRERLALDVPAPLYAIHASSGTASAFSSLLLSPVPTPRGHHAWLCCASPGCGTPLGGLDWLGLSTQWASRDVEQVVAAAVVVVPVVAVPVVVVAVQAQGALTRGAETAVATVVEEQEEAEGAATKRRSSWRATVRAGLCHYPTHPTLLSLHLSLAARTGGSCSGLAQAQSDARAVLLSALGPVTLASGQPDYHTRGSGEDYATPVGNNNRQQQTATARSNNGNTRGGRCTSGGAYRLALSMLSVEGSAVAQQVYALASAGLAAVVHGAGAATLFAHQDTPLLLLLLLPGTRPGAGLSSAHPHSALLWALHVRAAAADGSAAAFAAADECERHGLARPQGLPAATKAAAAAKRVSHAAATVAVRLDKARNSGAAKAVKEEA
ncbi:hypothetical protein FOA52_011287 [Chlamydomonas sp. UWO 241]|nr:hypothetical protein FOA52_011287 [Chlamydomonas sp. UWO 241]